MATRELNSAEAFAFRAVEVLFERIARSTRELERLRLELLRETPTEGLRDETRDLGCAAAALERDGWLFGLVGRELGSEVLFERRERRGLRHVLELVSEMLARDGIGLQIPALPELDGADPRCNSICAIVAHAVFVAHEANGAVEWSFTPDAGSTALRFASVEPRLWSVLEQSAARIDGARALRDTAGSRLVLPEGCLVWP